MSFEMLSLCLLISWVTLILNFIDFPPPSEDMDDGT